MNGLKTKRPAGVRQVVDILFNIAVLSHLQAFAGKICHHQLFNFSFIEVKIRCKGKNFL
jgi:hypothetical protein